VPSVATMVLFSVSVNLTLFEQAAKEKIIAKHIKIIDNFFIKSPP